MWNLKQSNAFTDSHALLIASVAGQLAAAVENLRYQQEERDRRHLNDARQTYQF
jgi:GAF domain-containing protein